MKTTCKQTSRKCNIFEITYSICHLCVYFAYIKYHWFFVNQTIRVTIHLWLNHINKNENFHQIPMCGRRQFQVDEKIKPNAVFTQMTKNLNQNVTTIVYYFVFSIVISLLWVVDVIYQSTLNRQFFNKITSIPN